MILMYYIVALDCSKLFLQNEDFIEGINDISPKVDETFRRLSKTAVVSVFFFFLSKVKNQTIHTQALYLKMNLKFARFNLPRARGMYRID